MFAGERATAQSYPRSRQTFSFLFQRCVWSASCKAIKQYVLPINCERKRDTSCHYYRRKNRVVDHPSLSFCSFLSIAVCIQNQCETETPHYPSSAWTERAGCKPNTLFAGGGSHLACTLDPVWVCVHSFSPWVVSYLWLAQKFPHSLDDRDKHFATFVGSWRLSCCVASSIVHGLCIINNWACVFSVV